MQALHSAAKAKQLPTNDVVTDNKVPKAQSLQGSMNSSNINSFIALCTAAYCQHSRIKLTQATQTRHAAFEQNLKNVFLEEPHQHQLQLCLLRNLVGLLDCAQDTAS